MSYLEGLLASTRARVEEGKAKVSAAALEQRIAAAAPPRGLAQALSGDGMAIIAEIKRRSPARGPLNLDLNAGDLARSYARGGAAAISVLTEPTSFRGSNEDLEAATEAGLPVLRKDFIVDEWQVLESRALGADAVLLIVRAVGEDLERLLGAARALGMDALVEVHTDDDVERALAAGSDVVGINHRDLESFEVDPERTAKLTPRLAGDRVVVALSGVSTVAEIDELSAAGADAVLVGEALVTAPDPAAKLRELLGR